MDFILVIIEVNDFLAMHFPYRPDADFMGFRKRLAYDIIFNYLDETDKERATKEQFRTRSKTQHELYNAPPFCNTIMENGKKSTRLSIRSTTVAWTTSKTATALTSCVIKIPGYEYIASLTIVLMLRLT